MATSVAVFELFGGHKLFEQQTEVELIVAAARQEAMARVCRSRVCRQWSLLIF